MKKITQIILLTFCFYSILQAQNVIVKNLPVDFIPEKNKTLHTAFVNKDSSYDFIFSSSIERVGSSPSTLKMTLEPNTMSYVKTNRSFSRLKESIIAMPETKLNLIPIPKIIKNENIILLNFNYCSILRGGENMPKVVNTNAYVLNKDGQIDSKTSFDLDGNPESEIKETYGGCINCNRLIGNIIQSENKEYYATIICDKGKENNRYKMGFSIFNNKNEVLCRIDSFKFDKENFSTEKFLLKRYILSNDGELYLLYSSLLSLNSNNYIIVYKFSKAGNLIAKTIVKDADYEIKSYNIALQNKDLIICGFDYESIQTMKSEDRKIQQMNSIFYVKINSTTNQAENFVYSSIRGNDITNWELEQNPEWWAFKKANIKDVIIKNESIWVICETSITDNSYRLTNNIIVFALENTGDLLNYKSIPTYNVKELDFQNNDGWPDADLFNMSYAYQVVNNKLFFFQNINSKTANMASYKDMKICSNAFLGDSGSKCYVSVINNKGIDHFINKDFNIESFVPRTYTITNDNKAIFQLSKSKNLVEVTLVE